jgi:hypothetical protein
LETALLSGLYQLQSKGVPMARQLNSGDPFPAYQVRTTDGRALLLPQDLRGEYAALIFYRGGW